MPRLYFDHKKAAMFDALMECVLEPLGEAILEWFVYFFSGLVLKGVEMVRDIWNIFLGR